MTPNISQHSRSAQDAETNRSLHVTIKKLSSNITRKKKRVFVISDKKLYNKITFFFSQKVSRAKTSYNIVFLKSMVFFRKNNTSLNDQMFLIVISTTCSRSSIQVKEFLKSGCKICSYIALLPIVIANAVKQKVFFT